MNLQETFALKKELIYFNHASSSPLPAPARERMKELIDQLAYGDRPWDFWLERLSAFRNQSARLLGCKASEICFIPNTSTGLLAALYSIPWKEGDNLILVDECFPANRIPWELNLPEVEKRVVAPGSDVEQKLIQAADVNTRAMAVDWVDFFTGYRIDINELGKFCRDKGIFLIVDGIQGVGAVSLDLSETYVDFLAAGSAKWLLGPVGAGVLYVSENRLSVLRPAFQGWMSLQWRDLNVFDPLPPLKHTAARLEPGSYPGVPLIGLVENLKLLNSVGMEEISLKVFQLRKLLLEGLRDMGAELITSADDSHASGIVTFRVPGVESKAVYDALARHNVVCSLRRGAVRLSPHFYNTKAEAEKVLEVIKPSKPS